MSEFSLGAWVTYGGQVGEDDATKCMSAAYDLGVNLFDNAEAYAHGLAKELGLSPPQMEQPQAYCCCLNHE